MNLTPAYKVVLENPGHKYYMEGKRRPGVTTITGMIDKSPGLMYYAAKQSIIYIQNNIELLQETFKKELNKEELKQIYKDAQGYYKEVTAQHADWGKATHGLIEDVNNGKKVDIISQPEQVQLAMTGYFDWAKAVEFESVCTELVVGSMSKGYCGMLDGIGYVEGKLSLIDYKSCNGLYNSNKPQVAGYYQAGLEMYPGQIFDEIEKFYVIRVDKTTGDFEVREIYDIKPEIEAFNNCLGLYKWNKKVWK